MKHRWRLIPATSKVLLPMASMITGTTVTRTRQPLPTTGQAIVTQCWESLARGSLRASQRLLQQANVPCLDTNHQKARLETWIHLFESLLRTQSTLKLTTVGANWKTDRLLNSHLLMTPSFTPTKSLNLLQKKKTNWMIETIRGTTKELPKA